MNGRGRNVKGRLWETAVANAAREAGVKLQRIRVRGRDDEGDLAGITDFLLECKNHGAPRVGEWLDQARAEAVASGCLFAAVIHKRRGKPSATDGFVTMTLADFIRLAKHVGLADVMSDGS